MAKRKIVLDADVIINFSRANILSQITKILPNYDYIVLDKVYNEVLGATKKELDNNIHFLKKISIVTFPTDFKIMKDCEDNNITHLGTIDFLYYAVNNGIMTEEEAIKNMDEMIAKGSFLPTVTNFSNYKPTSVV